MNPIENAPPAGDVATGTVFNNVAPVGNFNLPAAPTVGAQTASTFVNAPGPSNFAAGMVPPGLVDSHLGL
jgi:hypothetical protein